MAPITLPLSFTNSFWSQDYRKGLQVLFSKLEQVCAQNNTYPIILTIICQGLAENDEIVAFIRVRNDSVQL